MPDSNTDAFALTLEDNTTCIECELLALPHTFPDTGFAFELISVVEDHNDDCKMHVALSDSFDYAESWGTYLAEVADVIARDHADHLSTNRPDGDLLAAIYVGFIGALDGDLLAAIYEGLTGTMPKHSAD
jgi:hypothetical protein